MKATKKDQGQDKSFKVTDKDFNTASTTKRSFFVNCVEVAIKPKGVAVRDSKNRAAGIQYYTHDEWKAFTNGVKNGEFDRQ